MIDFGETEKNDKSKWKSGRIKQNDFCGNISFFFTRRTSSD